MPPPARQALVEDREHPARRRCERGLGAALRSCRVPERRRCPVAGRIATRSGSRMRARPRRAHSPPGVVALTNPALGLQPVTHGRAVPPAAHDRIGRHHDDEIGCPDRDTAVVQRRERRTPPSRRPDSPRRAPRRSGPASMSAATRPLDSTSLTRAGAVGSPAVRGSEPVPPCSARSGHRSLARPRTMTRSMPLLHGSARRPAARLNGAHCGERGREHRSSGAVPLARRPRSRASAPRVVRERGVDNTATRSACPCAGSVTTCCASAACQSAGLGAACPTRITWSRRGSARRTHRLAATRPAPRRRLPPTPCGLMACLITHHLNTGGRVTRHVVEKRLALMRARTALGVTQAMPTPRPTTDTAPSSIRRQMKSNLGITQEPTVRAALKTVFRNQPAAAAAFCRAREPDLKISTP